MAMTWPFIDGQAQQFPGQDAFVVNGSDYGQLLNTVNVNATPMNGGAYIQYAALMGGDVRRVVTVRPAGGGGPDSGNDTQPIDAGVAEGL